jgi:dTMP kinase
MFVVFEGIDGSGKTTLSGRVAAELEKAGLSVHQARPKGELKSRLASQIRTLARDPRNLTMSPHTELFLFIARDTQTIDTVIRPSLDKAQVVIADRYLYSPLVLCRARGSVPEAEVERAIDVAARGLWPDLVVYCDVDINTSAIRKRLDKFENPRAPDDFGRKGLRGLGLRAAMREVYLDLARKHPDTWFVVDNATKTIAENTALITDRILKAAGKAVPPRPKVTYPDFVSLSPGDISRGDAEAVRKGFYRYVDGLVDSGRVGEAAYHIRSMDSDEVWALRERLMDEVPKVIAYGLGPLSCERAMEMRRRLMSVEPARVVRSFNAEWADTNEEAWQMRFALADKVPVDVATTMGTIDTDRAWELRDRLVDEAPGQVLSSLKGLDSERAWQMRGAYGKKKNVPGLLRGLAYLESDAAWEVREKHQKNFLPWVIISLLGLSSERAFEIRRRHLETATKLVIRSMAGLEVPEAWAMRAASGPYAKEVLTTIKGITSEEAWRLRKSLSDTWPGPAAKSIGMTLAMTDEGYDFLWDMGLAHPHSPDVAHYLVKALEARERGER